LTSFERDPASYFADIDQAAQQLVGYFALDESGVPRFSGARFDDLGRPAGFDPAPDQITEVDLLAVEMLAVRVPAHAALWILGPGASAIHGLLRQIPKTTALWKTTDDEIGETSPVWQLWDLLRHRTDDIEGTGRVTTSKLLARKRPVLIPIQDSVVEGALGAPVGNFWSAMRAALQDTALRDALHDTLLRARRQNSAVPESLSPLRIVDIVIWMTEHGASNIGQGT
jgi:hypothetical protein